MNIFYLDKNPQVCAEMHTDKHTIKMILEYAQLLSTAHRVLDGTPRTVSNAFSGRRSVVYDLASGRNDVLYRATHINHPSAIWVRQSEQNYRWLFTLFCELLGEYNYRYGKIHACERLVTALGKQIGRAHV